jgi:hypothetical protein
MLAEINPALLVATLRFLVSGSHLSAVLSRLMRLSASYVNIYIEAENGSAEHLMVSSS